MAPSSTISQQQQHTQHLAPGDLLRVLHAAQPKRLAAAATARQVVAATDASMAPATRHDGRWLVPAEIVGLDSKKCKQAKIKFHPSTLEMARSDVSLANAVQKAIDDVIGIVTMDGVWRTTAAVTNNEMGSTAAKLRRLFGAVQPQLIVKGEILTLTWPLHTTPSTSKTAAKAIKEACAFLTGQAKMPLRARVRSEKREETKETKKEVEEKEEMAGGDAVMREEKKEEKEGEKRQTVEMECTLGGGSQSVQLWRLQMEGGGYLVEENDEMWREPEIELTSRRLSLRLRRSLSSSEIAINLPPRLPAAPTAAVKEEKGKERNTMVDAMQCRVEELRRKLDDSLAAFQKLSSTRGLQRETQRKIVVLSADRTETAIEICEAGARPRVRPLSASTPLQVMVADGTNGVAGEGVGGGHGVAGSPTESIDSGISNPSPSSSPSAVSPKASPFYQYSEESSTNAKLAMRSRSLSESASYSPIQMTPTLRGILKKTPIREYGRPMRGIFKRSLSESGDSTPFFILRSMTSFEDEPLEEVDEEDEDDAIEMAQEALPLQPRTKRVSFSENLVQKRSFRPSCSIVWHQQKAAKKNAKRDLRSRTMSEGDAVSDMWDEKEDTKSLVPLEELGVEEKSAPRETRKDSGYCDDDDDVVVSEGEEAEDEAEETLPTIKEVKSSPFSSLRTAPVTKSAAFTIGGNIPSRDWLRAASLRGPVALATPRTRIASASN